MVEARKWAGSGQHSPPPQQHNAHQPAERHWRNKSGDTITGTATHQLLYKR